MSVEATILVEFNSESSNTGDYIAIAELDDISNDSKTSFLPGEQPVIRSHFSNNIRVDNIVATAGSINSVGSAIRTIEHTNLFTSRDSLNPTEYELPVVPLSTLVSYDGRSGGYTTESLSGGRINLKGDVSLTPFLMRMVNTYSVNLYRLIPPSLTLEEGETYTIYVVFYVTLLEE